MRFLSALMPREGQFFDLFNKHAELIVEGAKAMSSLLQNYDSKGDREGWPCGKFSASKL